MADVLVVRDPDPSRRERCRDEALARLRSTGRTEVASFERGDVLVVWGAGVGAPISRSHAEDHDALLLGDRLPGGDAPRDDAGALAARCARGSWPGAADGFHLGVVVDDHGITAVVDTLGVMPLYRHRAGDCTFLVTAPGLLRAHERVDLRLDPVGVASVLLVGSPVGAMSCFRDVHRIRPRHAVRVPPDADPVEGEQHVLRFATDPVGVPFDALAHEFDDRLRRSIARHLGADQRAALLLSGGLDSRLVAGATRAAGRSIDAVTMGHASDLEHRFATRVAAAVTAPHRTVPDPTEHTGFEARVAWEGVHSTPVLEGPALDASYDRWLSGLGLDNVLGATGADRCYDPTTRSYGFDTALGRWNRAGLGRPLSDLVSRGEIGAGAVEAATEAVHDVFRSGGPDLLSQGWLFAQDHNDRYWVGKMLVHETADTWPVIPQYDREMLAITERVPIVALAGRRLEQAMLRLRYPDLAAIPLDRTNFGVDALDPRLVDQLRAVALRRSILLRRRLGMPVREVRRQTRILDFDNEEWRAVRRRVEHSRPHLHELFSAEVVDEVLPGPEESSEPDRHFPRSNGAKLLLSFAALAEAGISL